MTNDTEQRESTSDSAIDLAGRQVSVSVVASFVGMALRYAAAMFTTRILGVALFGTYVQAQTIVQLLSMSSTMGLMPGAVPFVAKHRLEGDDAGLRAIVRASWTITLLASVLFGAALFFAAPWLAEVAFEDAPLQRFLQWLAPMVVFGALLQACLAIVQGFKAMRVDALIEKFAVVAVTFCGLVVTWMFELGMPGVVVATVLGPAVGLVCAVVFVRERVPGVLRAGVPVSRWPVRSLLATCWPLLGSGLITFALASIDVLLLGMLRDSSEVGIYGASARLLPVMFVVHQSAARMFYAHASERFVAGDTTGIDQLYRRSARWSIWSGLGTATVLVIWSREILGLFGADYAEGAAVLAMLALGPMTTAMTGACGKALIAVGRLRQSMINVVVMLAINVVLNLLWIPEHGAYGAAAATLVSTFVVRFALVLQVWWLFRIQPWSLDTLVAVLVAGGAYLLLAPMHDGFGGGWSWLVPLAAFGAVWLLLYVVFGAGDEERAFLKKLLRRGG